MLRAVNHVDFEVLIFINFKNIYAGISYVLRENYFFRIYSFSHGDECATKSAMGDKQHSFIFVLGKDFVKKTLGSVV